MLEDLEFFEQMGLGEQYQDFMKEWRDSLELYRMKTFITGCLWLLFFEVAFTNIRLTGLLLLLTAITILIKRVMRNV